MSHPNNNPTHAEQPGANQASDPAFDPFAKLAPAAGSTIAKVIAVMSGKGGVGKSTVTALLAVALRRAGKRVGILDADITGPSIPRLFGLHDRPGMGPDGLIVPVATESGIHVISINLLLQDEDQPVIWRGPLIASAIKQFFNEVAWGQLDYLLVDLPPGTGDAPLTVLQSLPLDGIVLVTSPQLLAQMIVRKAQHMAESLNVPILGLVENFGTYTCPHCGQESSPFGDGKAEQMAAAAGVPVLGKLPIDPEVAQAGDAGKIESYDASWLRAMADWVK